MNEESRVPYRFFVTPDSLGNGIVTFNQKQAHHIRDVLRLRGGQEIIVLDNRGSEYCVALREVTRELVRGEIVSQRAARGEPPTKIVLYQALLKADKFEWVLQKGTEIGISEFVPMVSARAVADAVSRQKFTRWVQIVTEAAEQAGRSRIPNLSSLQSFGAALAAAEQKGGLLIVPWEQERVRDLKSVLEALGQAAIHLFVGPEGGFTMQEIERAQAHGAHSITLGPRILRAETAGLVAASAIFFARGDLNFLSTED